MRLTILGSGSFLPNKSRNCSGYLLDIGKDTILLDGGSGTLRQIVRADRSVLEITRLFYSHLHLDHIADFLPLLFTRKYYKPERPVGGLIVQAHPNFKEYFDKMTTLFEKWTSDPAYPTSFKPITPGKYSYPGFSLEVFPSSHTPESLLYRFSEADGNSMLYTGDVDLDDNLITASHAVDLLLIECGNLSEIAAPGHLNPEQIKTVIEAARPRRIVLTHLPPEIDNLNLTEQFGESLSGDITVAEDFMIFDI